MYDLSRLQTGALRRVHAKHGEFLVLAGDSAGIGALLAYYGEFCDWEITLMCALIQPGDTVIEVGANIGTHTIPLARRVSPLGRLVAIEAQPVAAMLLEANLALNAIGWVEVQLAAAGRAPGVACVPTVDYRAHRNVGSVSLVGAQSEGQIEVRTIDSMALRPSLIKIDVEGMELEVLEGAAGTIQACRPLLYVENNPEPVAESVAVLRWLRERKYDLYWDVRSLHEPANFRGQAQPFFSDGFSSNVLAVPHEKALPLSRFDLEPVGEATDHKLRRLRAAMGR
ncbi:MAG: FkbM family methyltransferase [Caulobacteraceae bacterium]|nr:FkbM family methyltransferase [Caulobacteraceae bacterium]